MAVATGDDAYKSEEDNQPVTLTKAEFSDLTRAFQRSLLSLWIHISKRNICWHQEQRSTGDRERELSVFHVPG